MKKLTTPSQIIDALGGTGAAAEIFGVGPSAISNYRTLGFSSAIRFEVSRECAKRKIPVADSAYEKVKT